MDTNSNRLTAEEIRKLREMNFCKEPGFVKAEAVLASEAGEPGSPERKDFDAKARAWYNGESLCDRNMEARTCSPKWYWKTEYHLHIYQFYKEGEADLQLPSFMSIADNRCPILRPGMDPIWILLRLLLFFSKKNPNFLLEIWIFGLELFFIDYSSLLFLY